MQHKVAVNQSVSLESWLGAVTASGGQCMQVVQVVHCVDTEASFTLSCIVVLGVASVNEWGVHCQHLVWCEITTLWLVRVACQVVHHVR